ncbi:MAG TPA: choice-of-anchor X domain-containing protein, partial [Candidatus Limnocylindrales bacterium]|nr:choice-of-anchor X domain-containing protein [Candidatus Limnocylindrales bacterium]
AIAQGQTQTHPIQIDEETQTAIWLIYGSGDLNLALVSPGGDVFDSTSALSDTNIVWEETPFPLGGMLESIILKNPKPGAWTARVSAPKVVEPAGVSGYMVNVLVESAIKLEAIPIAPEEQPIAGERLRIRARLTKGDEPIPGATVRATVVDPNEARREIRLSDDGIKPDSSSGDGLYTGETRDTSVPGQYKILVTASGSQAGEEQQFSRDAFTMAFIARSRSREDRLAVLEDRHEGAYEPPVEIRVRSEGDHRTGAHSYVYTVSNGCPYPITTFHIGTNPRTNPDEEIRTPPLGWEDVKNVPASSFAAPTGWRLLYGQNIKSRGSLSWSTRDTTVAIAPGQSLTGFRVMVAKPDPTYEGSHWSAFLKSERVGSYEGALVSDRGVVPAGDALERLGQLRISPKVSRGEVTVRYRVPKGVRPEVTVVDSKGRVIQGFPFEEGGGTEHQITWDGRNAARQEVPPGEYFFDVKYGNTERFGRVTLVR